jgi:hypothetical protein
MCFGGIVIAYTRIKRIAQRGIWGKRVGGKLTMAKGSNLWPKWVNWKCPKIPKPGIETYQLEQGVQMGVYFLRVSENVAVQQNLTGLVWFRLWAPHHKVPFSSNATQN